MWKHEMFEIWRNCGSFLDVTLSQHIASFYKFRIIFSEIHTVIKQKTNKQFKASYGSENVIVIFYLSRRSNVAFIVICHERN